MATAPRRSRTTANGGRRGSRRRSRAPRLRRRQRDRRRSRWGALPRSTPARWSVSGQARTWTICGVTEPALLRLRRRAAFMNRSIASSLTVLLAALAAAQEHPLAPQPALSLDAAWQQALTLAKTHKAPLLAFVLPRSGEAADAARSKATRTREMETGMLFRKGGDVPGMVTARDVLLRQVQMLRAGRRAGAREPLQTTEAQAVFAVTVPVFAAASVCESKPGETVVLFGPDGKRRKGFALDLL